MGTYKVQSNGKAQSGLSIGDKVVTGGGTYEITGVKSDGTYESKLSDKNTTTSNYKGSYSSGSSSKGSSSGSSGYSDSSSRDDNSYSPYTGVSNNTTWQPGAGAGPWPDMSRQNQYAGQSVRQGNYTVTYDDLGYAVSAKHDKGASATSYMKTTHANDSAAHQAAYQAAQRGDWDAVGNAINQIAMAGGADEYGHYDMKDAKKYYAELVNEFNYNAKNYYDGLYDKAYGAGSAAAWDASGGAIKTYQQLVDAVGADMAQQIIGTGSTASGQMAAPGYGSGALGGYGTTGGSYGGTSDPYQYIRDMYEQQAAAQMAALKSTYEQNVLDYQAQDDLISAEAQRQRNQAAAQNDLQRMYMNEMGIMQGLNTGATGQMALAQSAALQGNLANIGMQEQQSIADNALSIAKLKAQYSAAVDQAVADGNYQMAQALYNEYVRQDEIARQQQAAALEQANWEAKMAYQQAQDALAQQNWQAQFDYKKQQDDLDYKLALMKLNVKNGNGSNPGTAGTPVVYGNGSLTPEQVKTLQADINKYLPEGQKIAVDGVWGANTASAANGMTADEYAKIYYKQNAWSGRSDR